jgi:hypothetical protein
MGAKRFLPKTKTNPAIIVGREKALIEKHFDVINCSVNRGVLYCEGIFCPTTMSREYRYKIKYTPSSAPKVKVVDPIIPYNDDIHMFPKNNTLCLYHKTDMTWTSDCHLYDTIIPWTHEWFVYYELYQITGNWEHPFVPHKRRKEQE